MPLPWNSKARHFGFGPESGKEPHLPQPAWFAEYAVDVESGKKGSTLEMYKRALKGRKELIKGETLEWVDNTEGSLSWKRDGVKVTVNFTGDDVAVDGEVIVGSAELVDGKIPHWTTVWVKE